MPEYYGTPQQIEMAKRIRQRLEWIRATPGVVNGGRLLLYDDPDGIGWDTVLKLGEEDGLFGLTFFPIERLDNNDIPELLLNGWYRHQWPTFIGEREKVLPVSKAVVEAASLPEGWVLDVMPYDVTDNELEKLAIFQQAVGVQPMPHYVLRGEAYPIITTRLLDDRGEWVACGSAQLRHHPESDYYNTIFAGLMVVDPAHRGKRYGLLINAYTVIQAFEHLNGTIIHEHVAEDKHPISQNGRRKWITIVAGILWCHL